MKPAKTKAMSVTKSNFLAVSEAAWTAALRMEQFGYAEIATAVKISLEQATRIVRGWLKEGALDQVQEASGAHRLLWRCKADFVRIEPLRLRTPEENMWTAMRRLSAFIPTDLAAHATTETVTVTPEEASVYCRALLAAGYLRVARKADPSLAREAIYRLIDVTGPQAPVTRRVRAVVDPNTGETRVIGGLA